MLTRTVKYLDIHSIERNDELQARVALDKGVVEEYAADLRNGAVFPPVVVFHDGEGYWLVDGYHRTAARELLGHTTVLAEVRAGNRDDALWASVAANQTHGLRRTNGDKHRSVERALLHPRSQRLSNRQIATHCGVHHYTVGRIRKELECARAIEAVDTRQVTRDGSTYAQKILGIRYSNQERRLPAAAIPRRSDLVEPARRNARREGPPSSCNRAPSAVQQRPDEIELVMRLLAEAHKRLTASIHSAAETAGGSEEASSRHLCDVADELERLQQQLLALRERLRKAGGRLRPPSGGGAPEPSGGSILRAPIVL